MRKEKISFPGGVWPVMVTPFFRTGEVDYRGLRQLTDWYIAKGCSGLFAVCQSSEMFQMSLEERLLAAETVVEAAAGRVPVIASGNLSGQREDAAGEVIRMAETGVDAVILITNQFADADEEEGIWMERCQRLLDQIPRHISLGFYECPYPYKRLISLKNLARCKETGRFYFLKDTSCDIALIQKRLEILRGSQFQLYNANSTTLLESLQYGAAGFSGVMANFHPELYACLCGHQEEDGIAYLQDFLSVAAMMEGKQYPVNAKYHLQQMEGLPIDTFSRRMDDTALSITVKKEVRMLHELANGFLNYYRQLPERGLVFAKETHYRKTSAGRK